MKFDRLSSQDRAHLVNAVSKLFQRSGAKGAEFLLHRLSQQGQRLLRRLHAEDIVNEAVHLWVNAPRSRNMRAFRAALAGTLLPHYRRRAVRELEAALADKKPPPKIVNVEAEVR